MSKNKNIKIQFKGFTQTGRTYQTNRLFCHTQKVGIDHRER